MDIDIIKYLIIKKLLIFISTSRTLPGLDRLDHACTLALEHGLVTAAVILNYLYRLTSPTPPPIPETPATLRLTTEPGADCARYDRLRRPEGCHAH